MQTDPKHLNVMVVSPMDVAIERDVVEGVIDELNQSIAGALGYRLDCRRWETEVYPTIDGHEAQTHIDRQLGIEHCHIVVGLFWRRFGMPVSDAQSGAEHELRLAIKQSQESPLNLPVVMIYFKKEGFFPNDEDLEQLSRLFAFKKAITPLGIYTDIDDVLEFPQRLRTDLTRLLRSNLNLNLGVQRRIVPGKAVSEADRERLLLSNTPLYTFGGLDRETRNDGLFQDFRIDPQRYDNPNPVSKLWADAYRGCSISAEVEEAEPPHLRITFDNRQGGWPSNITIRPIREQALETASRQKLIFDARIEVATVASTAEDVRVSIRIINGWYQQWVHGPAGRHRLIQLTTEWQSVTVTLSSSQWWLFPSDGNHYFGPAEPDLRVIGGVVLEFGSDGIDRAGPGNATVLIRNVRLE